MNQKSPFDPPEVIPNSIVNREQDEAYVFDVWLLSGHTTPESVYYTYGRTEALYKVSPNDNSDVSDEFDSVLNALQDKYGAVDEPRFNRVEGDVFEIMVEIIPTDDASPYDSEFNHNTTLAHITPENDPELVSKLDAAFDLLREKVK